MDIYDYRYDRKYNQEPFDEIVEYILKVPCTNCNGTIEYVFRSYRYSENIFITDMFPKIYENNPDCFKTLTSHEGYSVNMRRIAITCLVIFIRNFISANNKNAMVISGSYGKGEKQVGMSRKLRLYWYFFSSLLNDLNLRAINLFQHNAFILVSRECTVDDSVFAGKYLRFKMFQNKRS